MSDTEMYIFGREFHKKWLEPRPLSEDRKKAVQNDQRIKKAREILKKYDDYVEFASDLEKIDYKKDRAQKLKRLLAIMSRYKTAVELGVDVAEAAYEADAIVKEYYAEAHKKCEENQIDYYTCIAAVDRKWQAVSIKATLDFDSNDSVVRRVWDKWRARLLSMMTP